MPNSVSRAHVFAMAVRMMGRTPTANAFVRYYETQFYPNYDEETGSRKEFGGYTFVPPKKGDTTPLVPVYQNKWDDWTNYWFYLGLATQEGMEESVTSNLPKANVFVSQMTPMAGFRYGELFLDTAEDDAALAAFEGTSGVQISRDLVEEGLCLDFWPLGLADVAKSFSEQNGYLGPDLTLRRPGSFMTNYEYVDYIERLANKAIGPYTEKEHAKKRQRLGDSP
jgi:hypothetical protein